MKTRLKMIVLFIVTTLVSCCQNANKKNKKITIKSSDENEKFETIGTDKLNKFLATKKDNLSAKEVMKLFYPEEIEHGEGNEKIEILEKILNNGNTLVILTHDNQLDDSVKGVKYLMELKRINDKWVVLSIKKNWKCWSRRGHTNWGIELCQ